MFWILFHICNFYSMSHVLNFFVQILNHTLSYIYIICPGPSPTLVLYLEHYVLGLILHLMTSGSQGFPTVPSVGSVVTL